MADKLPEGAMYKPYQQLVHQLGEEGAKAEMRRRRGLVKKPGYFDKVGKEELKKISSMGGKKRREDNNPRPDSQQKESA